MNSKPCVLTALGVLLACSAAPLLHAQTKPAPTVQLPQPGVPEIMTMEANFVRAAYNNEGYVILGYEVVNRSLGEQWVLLDVGMTVMDRVPNYTLRRADLTLDTPDGKTLPLPSVTEFRAANTAALQSRSRVQRDSINYFPPKASRACRLGFFSDLDSRAMAFDEVELSDTRACLGRLYFHLPDGIKHGQHWLNVKFANSVIRVPFRIFTADEEKLLSKNYKSIKRQIDDAFKRK